MDGEKEAYKYLGILDVNTIKQVEMKEKNKKGVFKINERNFSEPSSEGEDSWKE